MLCSIIIIGGGLIIFINKVQHKRYLPFEQEITNSSRFSLDSNGTICIDSLVFLYQIRDENITYCFPVDFLEDWPIERVVIKDKTIASRMFMRAISGTVHTSDKNFGFPYVIGLFYHAGTTDTLTLGRASKYPYKMNQTVYEADRRIYLDMIHLVPHYDSIFNFYN